MIYYDVFDSHGRWICTTNSRRTAQKMALEREGRWEAIDIEEEPLEDDHVISLEKEDVL